MIEGLPGRAAPDALSIPPRGDVGGATSTGQDRPMSIPGSRRRFLASTAALWGSALVAPAAAGPRTAPRVVLHTQPGLRRTAYGLWFAAGSVLDPMGRAGIGHLFEHLLSRGTGDLPDGDYARTLQALGGEHNALIEEEATCFHAEVDDAALVDALRLEARRFGGLRISPEVLRAEQGVVLDEERMLRQEDVLDFAWGQCCALNFPGHPYGRPVVGYPREIEAVTLADLKAYEAMHHQPEACRLVIVSGLPAPTLRAAVAATMPWLLDGPLATPLPTPPVTAAPTTGVLRFDPASSQGLVMAWRLPRLTEPDIEALDGVRALIEARTLPGLGTWCTRWGVTAVRTRVAHWSRAGQVALMFEGVAPARADAARREFRSLAPGLFRGLSGSPAWQRERLERRLARLELNEHAEGLAMQIGWQALRRVRGGPPARDPLPIESLCGQVFAAPGCMSVYGSDA